MKNKNKCLGLSSIIWAFVFLFNPNLNIVDILPDFIGYAIICASISKLADMNEDISTAHKGFTRALFVDVIKFVCIFVVFATSNPNEQNTLLLLVSFVFAVVELFLLIPAFKALFSGITQLGYKFENRAILGRQGHISRKNYTEKIAALTYGFLIVKVSAYVLPEFAVLSTHSYDELSGASFLYDYVGLLRFFAIVVGLIMGIVWLCRAASYFSRVSKDKIFTEALVDCYNKTVLPRESLFVKKAVKLISLLFCVAAAMCIDFRMDSFNIIIDTIAAIILIISAILTKKYVGKRSKTLLPFVVYAVVSLVAVVFEYRFFNEYFYGAIYRNDEAFAAYRVMLAWSVADAVAFLLAVFGMANMIGAIIKDHTGFAVPQNSVDVTDKIKKVHAELNKKVYLLYFFAVLAAASDLFYDFGAATFKFAGFVNTIFAFVFLCTVISVTNSVREEVESKYMLL